jgi:hypothetical protein
VARAGLTADAVEVPSSLRRSSREPHTVELVLETGSASASFAEFGDDVIDLSRFGGSGGELSHSAEPTSCGFVLLEPAVDSSPRTRFARTGRTASGSILSYSLTSRVHVARSSSPSEWPSCHASSTSFSDRTANRTASQELEASRSRTPRHGRWARPGRRSGGGWRRCWRRASGGIPPAGPGAVLAVSARRGGHTSTTRP